MPTLAQREIRSAIYRLKRRDGIKVQFRSVQGQQVDWKQLDTQHNATIRTVKKAIVFTPTKSKRDLVYDLSYIAGGKNFTQGAFFDEAEISILVLINDLKGDDFQVGDNFVFSDLDKQFEITRTNDFRVIGKVFSGKAVIGASVDYAPTS